MGSPLAVKTTEGEGNVPTESIRANMVTSETVHLGKFATVDGTNVEEVLPTFPHLK